MPMPPILPILDWKAIFESGKTFEEWLKAAKSDQNRQALQQALASQALLGALPRPVYVVAIAEDWCGDVRRHVPVLQRLAHAAPNLEVRFFTREMHKDVFVRFLTNGGEAIPKFVFCSEDFVEVGNWGPMPSTPRKWIAQEKACNDVGSARQKVGEFYQTDKHQESTRELLDLLQTAAFQGF